VRSNFRIAGGQQLFWKNQAGKGMTQGTSPHGTGLSGIWAGAEPSGWGRIWHSRRLRLAWRRARRLARAAASLPPLALGALGGLTAGLALTAALNAVADNGDRVALLIATGAGLAAIGRGARAALRRATSARVSRQDATEAPSRLLAQMQHELRTPLNAVLGFSEAMQAELHGPLGSSRYQEYAAHISESGGRLLKASEDALAVAATMSALLADRRGRDRDRLPVSGLLEEAWTAARAAECGVRLDRARCGRAEVVCDWQATSQALQLLMGEALAHLGTGGAVIAATRSEGGARVIELSVAPPLAAPALDATAPADGARISTAEVGAGGLRLILTRSLLDVQGATLSVAADPQRDGWKACIAFPSAAARRAERRRLARPTVASNVGAPAMARLRATSQTWC
jgi:signal transduction histidine kinase